MSRSYAIPLTIFLVAAVLVIFVVASRTTSNEDARATNTIPVMIRDTSHRPAISPNVNGSVDHQNHSNSATDTLDTSVLVDFSKISTPELLDLLLDACKEGNEDISSIVEHELRARVRGSHDEILARLFEYSDGRRELPENPMCLTKISIILASVASPTMLGILVDHLRQLWLVDSRTPENVKRIEAWNHSVSPDSPKSLLHTRHWVLVSAIYRQFVRENERGRLACPKQLVAAIHDIASNTEDLEEFADPWLSACFLIGKDLPDILPVLQHVADNIIQSPCFSWPLRKELTYLYNQTPRSAFELADKITDPEGRVTRDQDVLHYLFRMSGPTFDDLLVVAEALARTGIAATGDSFPGIRGEIVVASTEYIKDLMRETFKALLRSTPGTDEARVLIQLLYDLSVDSKYSVDGDRERTFEARTRGAWLPSVDEEERLLVSNHINGYWKEYDGRPVPEGLVHVQLHVVLSEIDLDVHESCSLLLEHWSVASQAIGVQSRYMALQRLMNRRESAELSRQFDSVRNLLACYVSLPPPELAADGIWDPTSYYFATSIYDVLRRCGFPPLDSDITQNLWLFLDNLNDTNSKGGSTEQERRKRKVNAPHMADLRTQYSDAGYPKPR